MSPTISRQLGKAEDVLAGVRELLSLEPEIARAAPQLYDVRENGNVLTCQRRAACCLYFKSACHHFCASCPIIPEQERLERNRSWVSAQRA